MMQVLWMQDPMGQQFVAALLNAALGLTPPLTETKAIDICVEYETRGFFEPTAGVHWYEQDISSTSTARHKTKSYYKFLLPVNQDQPAPK